MTNPQVYTGEKLIALRMVDPEQWAALVREAMLTAGTYLGAARELGVSMVTMRNWVLKNPEFSDLPLIKNDYTDAGRRIAALRVIDRAQFLKEVKETLLEFPSIPVAAESLGVSAVSLRTWIKEEPELSVIPVAGRGRPRAQKVLDKADFVEMILALGGKDRACEVLGIPSTRLDRYLIENNLPDWMADKLRKRSGVL